MHTVHPTTRDIVSDYFNWRLMNEISTPNRLYEYVRQIAFECERMFAKKTFINFTFSSSNHLKSFHYEIGKELFNDGVVTWSRILTFISFSAILTREVLQQQGTNDYLRESIIEWTTNFIEHDLQSWMNEQNSWTGFLKTFERRYYLGRCASILGTIGESLLSVKFLTFSILSYRF